MSARRTSGRRGLVPSAWRWGLGVTLLAGLASCDSAAYGHLQMYQIGGDPQADASPEEITLPEGSVLVLEVRPQSDSGARPYDGLERLKLRPVRSDVAMVRRGILRDSWVINGVRVGSTTIDVQIDDDVVDSIALEVVEPSP